ncbi:MAG: discoidin domain-containing protein [Desulfobacterales bacterium]|nr:discoidin domain-containing protein [Desulfobacterales bacterium]
MNNKINSKRILILSFSILFVLSIFTKSSALANTLVVAPHPDDDVIMASGVIFRALQNGEPVKVVFMTNGDFGSIQAGYNRLAEAVKAQNQLGMDENDLLFLGYPDGGLNAIRTGYPLASDLYVSVHGQSVTYGNRGLGRSDYHSHRFGSPAQYNGRNITVDLKTIISEFLPEHIFTTSEYDVTSDHTTTYQFVGMALAQLAAENPSYTPTVHKTIVWAHNSSAWPNAYDPTAYFSDAIDLSGIPLLWNERESLDVPVLMQTTHYPGNPKYLAADAHYSQNGASSFLGRWVHKDEVFWVEQASGTNRPPVVAAGIDQTVAEGATVQLNGTGSFDKDGGALSYEWRQVEGSPVALSDIHSATPAFVAPTGIARDELISFELVVSDSVYDSYADAVNVVILSSASVPPVYTDITASVTSVTASTVHATSDVSNLIDGCIDGYPQDAACEWTSNGQKAGAWIQLNWDSPVTVGKVVLYDRVNLNDQILQGTIAFSDGTTLNIGLLDNVGRGGQYSFAPKLITSLRYTITGVSSRTSSVGLSEIQVFAVSSGSVPNLAPTAKASAKQTVTEGDSVQLNGTASSDPNGDALEYLWLQTGGPVVVLSDPLSASPTFTAPTGLSGDTVLRFELTVHDGDLDSIPSVVHVMVQRPTATGVNIAPLATATASSQVKGSYGAAEAIDGCTDGYPGDSTCEWIASYSAVKVGAWLQLTWPSARVINGIVRYHRPNTSDQITSATLTFSNGASQNIGPLNNDGSATEFTFAPVQTTTLRMTVNSVRGNVGLSEIQVFESTASGINRAPIAQASAPLTIAENALVQLTGSQSYDPDGDPITYLWSQTSGPSVVLSDRFAADPTFTAPSGLAANTVLGFTLTVNDGQTNSAPAQVNVTVLAAQPVNHAPVANAGIDQTVQSAVQVILNGTSSNDPDGDPITYQWIQTGGASVTLSNATAAVPTFIAPSGLLAEEVLNFALTVNDGQLNSTPSVVRVTVQMPAATGVNIAPLATATASSQANVTYSAAQAIDGCIDGYPGDSTCEWIAKYTAVKIGAWLQLTWSGPHVIDRIVLYDRPNTSDQITSATITMSDGSTLVVGPLNNNGSATEYNFAPVEVTSLRMTVNSVRGNVGLSEIEVFDTAASGIDRSPVAQVGSAQTVSENAFVQLTGSQSFDPDGDTITYLWTQISGPVVLLSDSTAADPTFNAPVGISSNAVLTFELIVSDAELDSPPAQVNITVLASQPANLAPIANAGSNHTVQQVEIVTLNGSASTDPNGDALTYQWTQTSGQPVVLSDGFAASPTFTAPSGASADEVLRFELIVNDGALNSAASAVQVTVQAPSQTGANIALMATATASSQAKATYSAAKAIDGCTDGYPGDSTCEWIAKYTEVKVGAWLQLTWSSPQVIDRMVLFDRPNSNDQITSATITLSDGSSLSIGPLNNNGSATEYIFPAVETTSLRMTVNSLRGNVGLSEIQVFEAQ